MAELADRLPPEQIAALEALRRAAADSSTVALQDATDQLTETIQRHNTDPGTE